MKYLYGATMTILVLVAIFTLMNLPWSDSDSIEAADGSIILDSNSGGISITDPNDPNGIYLNKTYVSEFDPPVEYSSHLLTEIQYRSIISRLSDIENEMSLQRFMEHEPRIKALEKSQEIPYDPKDAIYSFLEPAEPNWVTDYGDNERTRLIYNISKLRVIMGLMSKRIIALENLNDPNLYIMRDPNEAEE